jgi:hypothetical protein
VVEGLGGIRARRLVSRCTLCAVIVIVGLVALFSIVSAMPNGPFAAAPTPDGGMCPVGWMRGLNVNTDDLPVPDGTCQRVPELRN